MRIDIRVRGVEMAEELRGQVERRLHFGLSRFGSELTSVLVRIDDVNGPRGGADKRCHLTVAGARIGTIAVEHLAKEPLGGLDVAVDRAARSVGRGLERLREKRAGKVRPPGNAPR